MPIYEYQCTECENTFEFIEKHTKRKTKKKCPICGSKSERIISTPASPKFNGTGFYETDYKAKHKPKED